MKRVVISSAGVVCGLAQNLGDFARALRDCRTAITFRDGRLEAGLHGFSWQDHLDAMDLPPQVRLQAAKLLNRASSSARVTTCAALEAWHGAKLTPTIELLDRAGIIVGGSNLSARFAAEQREKFRVTPEFTNPRYGFGFFDSHHVGILSQLTGIRGVGQTVGGASASGNLAVMDACLQIQAGRLDVCLAVGAMSELSALETHSLKLIGAMNPTTGPVSVDTGCWPFDASARGFVPGEGAAGFVLEERDHALRRGARVLAEVVGCGQALDANAGPEPAVEGESRAMRKALIQAGWSASDVDYVNTHGTASTLGDQTECQAIREVFGGDKSGPWLNATKGLTGHCLCGAGAVELAAVLVQMRDGFLHPNLHLLKPVDSQLRFVGGTAMAAQTNRALNNSFGFSGINTCLALAHGNS